MEVINYVQNDYSRKIHLPVFQRKEKPVHYSRNSFTTFQSETKVLSFREVLIEIGHYGTEVLDKAKKNRKAIFTGIAVLCGAAVLSFLCIKFVSHTVNFTGPLKLEQSEMNDLDKIMSNFALEGTVEIDESGKIIDGKSSVLPENVYATELKYETYTVKSGDTISGIAKKFGLSNISTLISVNDISNVRQLAKGQKLKIPSIDGIIYTVKSGDTIASIVSKNKLKLETFLDVNEIVSENLVAGQQVFLPGASLDQKTLKTALGDKFILPITAKFRWSSPYGKRIDPIAGVESFHTGTDMACPTGTPILASMSGTVVKTGVTRVYGNYVLIDHGNGYQTLYAHMSKIIATKGQWVSQGTRIGLVGSTGYSTGPHLHFTVYKNGKLVDPMTVLK